MCQTQEQYNSFKRKTVREWWRETSAECLSISNQLCSFQAAIAVFFRLLLRSPSFKDRYYWHLGEYFQTQHSNPGQVNYFLLKKKVYTIYLERLTDHGHKIN